VTKYRKPILDNRTEERLLTIIEEIVNKKGYKILEIGPHKDHIHILLELDKKKELPGVVRTLKAVTAKKMLEETPHLRVGNVKHLWARRYGYKEIKQEALDPVRKYIRNQKKIPHM
jgi:putative transposase